MDFASRSPTPLEYFASLVRDDEGLPLLEAAVCIAQDEEPSLDVARVLDDVERMLRRVRLRLTADADDLTRLAVLTQVFYKELGFGLNANDYYAPENSYVHEVLRTRRGIPVSLAVIWLELAQGLGLRAQGVPFPGHFLVKITLEAGLVVMDPLSGQSLGLDSLAERLAPFRQGTDRMAGACCATSRKFSAARKTGHDCWPSWTGWWCCCPGTSRSGAIAAWYMPNWAMPDRPCRTFRPTWRPSPWPQTTGLCRPA
jgi:hypothetical protein